MLITPDSKFQKFNLNKIFKDDLLTRTPEWKFKGLSEFTFYRTYSRKKENGTLETWNECVVRVIEGMFSILKTHTKLNKLPWNESKAQKHAKEASERLFTFKWTPPGRGLWIMGTDFMWEKGGAALNNCGFVSTEKMSNKDVESVVKPFTFLMDMSMLGVGVGFDTVGGFCITRNQDLDIKVNGYSDDIITFVVEDTREGWVEYIGKVIENCIFGGPRVIPDISKVRLEGAQIRGFGGVASGPLPLIQSAKGIEYVLNNRKGQSLTSVDIVDIQNLIGKCVVSGNVRRTAEIAFAHEMDEPFSEMKDFSKFPVETGCIGPEELKNINKYDYDLYNKHIYDTTTNISKDIVEKYKNEDWAFKFGGWRWTSNNSVFANVGMDYSKYENSIGETGEPGFAWLDLMQKYGRMKDGINNKDYRVKGGNPCLEQSLEPYELCCLVETYPFAHNDYWDFQRTLKFAYLYAKAVTLMATHEEETNAVIIRNRRIGCSMSGIIEAMQKFGRTNFLQNFCDKGYNYIDYVDNKYSEWLGVPLSIKKTSCKPSGTVSLVAGSYGPGVHYPKMSSGYRTIRVSNNSNIIDILKKANYKIEPSVTDALKTSVIYFPWIIPEGVHSEDDVTIWEQFKNAADLQYWWADNQVSCTVGVSNKEKNNGEISRCLTAFDGQIKGISLLPKSEGVYQQMPFTKAPKEEVLAYMETLKELDFSSLLQEGEAADSNKYCDSEGCSI